MATRDEPILEAANLTKYYDASQGFIDSLIGREQHVKAVDGVDFAVREGETLGVVGESGCGKTTLGRAVLRLIEPTDGSITYRQEQEDGSIEAIDLTDVSSSQLRDLRTDLQYIFQDPFASLNPRLTVGDIIGEPLDIHDIATGEARRERIHELLDIVGLNPSHADRYPHEFSGGQRQRIGIARALAVDPEVIICDEPVSALDVSVQAQILNLLEELQEEFGIAYVFIAHDLSVVEHISDRIAVMYLGEFAEVGTTAEVFGPPSHPYAEALLSAIPEPDPGWDGERIFLPGNVPSPLDPPSGCRFHTRCPHVIPPEEYDVDQDIWRNLLDLKLRAREAEDIQTLVDLAAADPSTLDREEFDRLVHDQFDLPEKRTGPDDVTAALDALYAGDLDGAGRRLEELADRDAVGDRRGLAALRGHLDAGVEIEQVLELPAGVESPRELSRNEFGRRLRNTFDIPDAFDDAEIESATESAIDALHRGNRAGARRSLETATEDGQSEDALAFAALASAIATSSDLKHLLNTEDWDGDLADFSGEEFDRLVRTEFDLPASIPDARAESVLSEAVTALREDGIQAAHDRLQEAFVSPCETTEPTLRDVGDGHSIHCLLYEDEFSHLDHGPTGENGG